MSELTTRQQQVYDCIRDYQAAHGCAPTIRELQELLGITSPNGIMCHLKALNSKGRLTWNPTKSRTLKLIGEVEPGAVKLQLTEEMHKRLFDRAHAKGLSLNQFCVAVLEREVDR